MVRFFKDSFLRGMVFFGHQLHHSEQKIPLIDKAREKIYKHLNRERCLIN
ncbi:hypothetical protein [Methylosarcina fibrata]|nr:hypothetical protein [Methylosarcina fibrata]